MFFAKLWRVDYDEANITVGGYFGRLFYTSDTFINISFASFYSSPGIANLGGVVDLT